MTASSEELPRVVLPDSRATYPHAGAYLGAAVAALGGALALAPVLVPVGYFLGWDIAVVAWVVWAVLGVAMCLKKPSSILARTLGSRAPSANELRVLEAALIRTCVSAGADVRTFAFRIVVDEPSNAYSAGYDIIAVSEDLISGDQALDRIELEAVIAHELGHHRHGDNSLAGGLWWYVLPLRLLEMGVNAIARLPLVGRPLAVLPRLILRLISACIRTCWLATSAGREFLADRFAVDCGYAIPLQRFFTRLASYEDSGAPTIVGVLTATHPPMADRIAKIRAQMAGDPYAIDDSQVARSAEVAA